VALSFPEQPKTKVVAADEAAGSKEPVGSSTFINCDLRFFNL